MNFIETCFIDDLSVCDDIIKHFKDTPEKFKGRGTVGGTGPTVVVNLDRKDSFEMIFDPHHECGKKYAVELDKCLKNYIKKYPFCSSFCDLWTITEGVNIQYYKPGGGFKTFHSERTSANSPEVYRHLVFMTYLNDVTEGGETEFYHQNLKVKAEKGKTVIWPADWTHAHRGIVSETQEKYIVTGWFSFVNDSST